MANIDLLKNIANSIYNPQLDVVETIEKLYHPNYEQCINGVDMNRTQYIQHVIAQREKMTIDRFNFQHFLEKGNELFALYNVKGKNLKNLPVEAEVIAYFLFESQQVLRIHGHVRLMKGDLSDVDMKET
jgi:D-lyxose ketol-isomerase